MAATSILSITTVHLMCDNMLRCGRTIMSESLFKIKQHLQGVGGEKLILSALLNLVSSLSTVYKDNRKNWTVDLRWGTNILSSIFQYVLALTKSSGSF